MLYSCATIPVHEFIFPAEIFEDLEFYFCRNTIAWSGALALLFRQNLTFAGRLSFCSIHLISHFISLYILQPCGPASNHTEKEKVSWTRNTHRKHFP